MAAEDAPLLEIEGLRVSFPGGRAPVAAVNGVDLVLHRGESLGLVGESGSGKTVTAMSVLRLVRGAETAGEIRFEGRDLLTMSRRDMRRVRGGQIGMVFQDPMSSLNPTQSIGRQIAEVVEAHQGLSRRDATKRALELLELVGIVGARVHLNDLPHEFSGGMRQRVMIAMAISCDPKLVIADEPTTALDVTTQAQVLELLRELQRELGMAMILITHDFGVVREVAQRVGVMYAGRVVETGALERLSQRPWHPYTQGLLRSVPKLDDDRWERLGSIGGAPPNASALLIGCPFAPRCEYAMDICRTETPPERQVEDGWSRCWLEEQRVAVQRPQARRLSLSDDRDVLLEVDGLTVVYGRGGLFRRARRGGSAPAVDGISFSVRRGETLGLVGESGSGKSTTGRAILRLVPVTEGHISFEGDAIETMDAGGLRRLAREVKIVFQDSLASLDPRMTVLELVEEPLRIHSQGDGRERRRRVGEVLSLVGLEEHFLSRYAHELSGGQRQRVGVARSLVLSPKLIICDEPVSALDVSVQAQVINLFGDLKEELSLTYIFISHDLRIVRHLADRIAVMYRGRIVEIGPTDELFAAPRHPYTQLLLASVPESSRGSVRVAYGPHQEQAEHKHDACVFVDRCPLARELCRASAPQIERAGAEVAVACHFWQEAVQVAADRRPSEPVAS